LLLEEPGALIVEVGTLQGVGRAVERDGTSESVTPKLSSERLE
jgi:hypothetical protein